MTTLTLPRVAITSGKRKQRSQMCIVYTKDGRCRALEWEVNRSCILASDVGKGYLISDSNQFRQTKDGKLVDQTDWQLIFEDSSVPIALRQDLNIKDLTKLIDQIFATNHEEAKNQQYLEANKNKLMDKMMWLVAMPCVVGLIWGALTLIKR